MVGNKLLKKTLVIWISILFIGINAIVTAEDSFNPLAPSFLLIGQQGDNGWFISDVRISFQYSPAEVTEIWYKFGDQWKEYDEPFNVTTEGSHIIPWYWIDKNNSKWSGVPPIEFKTDKTPPTVKLTRQKSGKNSVIFTAKANDTISGIARVDFYSNDVFKQSDSAEPYQYTWTGTVHELDIIYAIVYNNAGLYKISNNLTTVPKALTRNLNLLDLYFSLMNRIILRFY